MDTRITEFIDILTDNSVIIKRYETEWIGIDDPRYDNFEFDEKRLLGTEELWDDELEEYIELKSDDLSTARCVELNHFSKTESLENFLESEFVKFKQAIASNFNQIDKTILKEIANKIKGSRNQLELFIRVDGKNKFPIADKLMSVKVDFCNETIRFIDYSTFIFTNDSRAKNGNEEGKPNQAEVKPKPKKQLENLTCLTQNQVVILFHYLRQLGFIGKEMPKNVYAQHISELTGFAQEKIRQNLSHIDKESQSLESVLFTEADYSVVRRAMDKLISTLKTDSEEKFS